ncbi:MAG: PAS domain-containing protein, partial [Myxococcota bacterium]
MKIIVAQSPRVAAEHGDDAIRVLSRLGPEARIEVASDAGTCLGLCADGAVDLVVVDQALGPDCHRILTALRDEGPPVIAVNREATDELVLDAFRHGAADCVTLSPDDHEALAVVALEQLQRARAAREQVSAERRIRDLERYTENIIQNMNSALLVVGLDGCVTFCNPPAGKILGEDAESLIGRDASAWFGGGPGEESLLKRTLGEDESFKGAERIITRTDGTPVPVGISCSPFFDSAGQKIGAVAIFQDLSEMKQLQSQVLQTEKMASIGQLAAGVAHEINNPMGFIHANLFQMAEYLDDMRWVWDGVDQLTRAIEKEDADEIARAANELRARSSKADI